MSDKILKFMKLVIDLLLDIVNLLKEGKVNLSILASLKPYSSSRDVGELLKKPLVNESVKNKISDFIMANCNF